MIKPKTTINIDGKNVSSFDTLTLKQEIHEHHHFKLSVHHDEIERFGNHTIDESKIWLGKTIVITLGEKDFLGVITNVSLDLRDGFHGYLVIEGYSKTILLEAGEHMQSWLRNSISHIIKDTVKKVNLDVIISPEVTAILPYESQYFESHYQFLKRLAKQHNEWFFYDGLSLHFGKPTLEKDIEIAYGEEISEMSINMTTTNHTASLYSYDLLNDRSERVKSNDRVEGLNELSDHAFWISKNMYPILPNTYSSTLIDNKSQIDKEILRKQAAAAASLNTITAKSNDQRLGIGSVINVSSAKYDNKTFEKKRYGRYIIISITHHATGNYGYHNKFKAIPAGVAVLPSPKIELPTAYSQIAIVVSNEDSMQKGRVKVRFLWQTETMNTDWIPVMTPYAGSSAQYPQNRGCVFIPEKNDLVIVDFLHCDPNQPFVSGSVFNGKTGAGGKDHNNFKSIATRSGHLFEFNDTPKNESITVKDINNNEILIDTAKNIINITANELIKINAKNIEIIALNEIKVNAGTNMSTHVKEDHSITSKNSTERIEANKTVNAKEVLENAEKVRIESSKQNMELVSTKQVDIQANDKIKLF